MPVRYVIDAGALGPRSRQVAVAMVTRALATWQEVPTAALKFEAAGSLARDITGSSVLEFMRGLGADDPSPILLDSDGSIVDALLGRGASQVILGIAWPHRVEARTGLIRQSFAALNGFLYSLLSDSAVLGSIVHELGHFAGMAHSQVNADELYDGDPNNDHVAPAMFYRGPNDPATLHADDRAWFSWMYPAADFASRTGTIRGRVLLPDRQTGLRGIHVIARRVGDPQMTAVSAVSGFLGSGVAGGLDIINQRDWSGGASDPARLGEFLIPGLPPGSYTLEVQPLADFPSVPVPLGYLLGGARFWSDGIAAPDPVRASSPILVSAGAEVSGIDVVLKGESLGEPQSVAARDPASFAAPMPVALPVEISGTIASRGGGPADPPIESVEDLLKRAQAVFQVTLTQWTTVTAALAAAQAEADLDLYLARFVGGEWVLEDSSYQEGTPPEVVQLRLPPGRYLLAAHRYTSPGTGYTLRVMATPAPDPERVMERARIRYLILGDVTTSSAVARWETTLETPSVVHYRRPLREEGSSTRTRSHLLRLTGLAQGQLSPVLIIAGSEGGLDQAPGFVVAALPAAGFAAPRLVAESIVGPPDIAGVVPVIVVLDNEGLGDAMNVRIRQVTLPAGWQVVGATPLPPVLEVGGIGARGVGLLVLQLQRLSGSAAPGATIRGSYTDATGLERQF